MASYKDYQDMLNAYYAKQGPAPTQPYFDPQAEVSGYGQAAGYADALKAYQDYTTNTGQGWLDSLTPQQRAEYNSYHQQAVDANKKKARTGAIIALGAPLMAAGAGAALGGFGSLGTAGEAAATGAMSFPVYSPALPVLTDIPGLVGAGVGAAGAAAGGAAGGAAPAASGAGLLGTAGSAAGSLGSLGSLGGAIGAVGGGLLGATQKNPTDTQTRTIDPRMANYLYGADGNGGVLGGAYDLWRKQMATGGLNKVQNEGLNSQLAALRSPAYTQGYDAMRSSGLGLLNAPIAGNPFTKG